MSKISKLNSNPKKTAPSQGFVSLLEDFHEPRPFKGEGRETNQMAASGDLPFVPVNIFKATKQGSNNVTKTRSGQSVFSKKALDSLLEEFHDKVYEEDGESLKGKQGLEEEVPREAEQEANRIIEDAEKRAQQLIKAAEKKTAQMIEEAEVEAQQIHQTAKESGYNQGITEGRQNAYEEAKGQLSTLAQTLANLIDETAATKELIIKETEEEILSLTLTIASKLASIELSINRNAIVEIVKRGLQLLKDKKDITIKVSEEEFELLKTYQSELLDFADGIENISIEKDTALTLGDCFLYADSTLVDNTFRQRLENATTAIWQSYHEGS